MKNKFSLFLAVTIALTAMTSCKDDEAVIMSDFGIDSDEATYDSSTNTFNFNGERSTATISVVTGDANGRWDARCPTEDLWCSFNKEAGNLVITVARNATDKIRKSHITIVLDDQEKTVNIQQDYVRNLTFVSSRVIVGASSGTYKMGMTTNVLPGNLSFSVTDTLGNAASENFWLTMGTVSEDNTLSYSVVKNHSETEERKAIVTVSGEGVQASFKVIQNMASGKPYIVPLENLDYGFEDCLSYEIRDEVNNVKIGEICKEYLLKGTVTETTVNEVAVIAYPMVKGKPDHTNGFIIATINPSTGEASPDGGSVMWNSDIDSSTSGSDMLAARQAGEMTSLPLKIYMPFGGNSFTAAPLDEEDMEYSVTAAIHPWTVIDRREGEEIDGRGTFDEFTYRVVKIGCQYWFADNLKTTRFTDGTPIPTGSDNWNSDKLISGPACASAGYTSSGISYSNANANAVTDNAVAVRNETGPVYDYFALFNATNDVTTAFEGPFTDALSPSGWGVPTRAEFTILHNYVTQTSEKPESDPSLSLVKPSNHETTATNLTGFGASSYRYRSASGTNSSNGIHYAIVDAYTFNGTAGAGTTDNHSTVAFCCGTDTNTSFREADLRWGIYVRCIKRSEL